MKQSLLIILAVILCSIKPLSAQQKTTQSMKDIFLDGEYFLANEDYEEALFAYNTILKKGYSENANINYRIGQCYLSVSGSKHQAPEFLEKAVRNVSKNYVEGSFRETKAPLEAWFFLGNAYRINNDFDKAIEAYKKYESLIVSKTDIGYKLAEKEIDACKLASEMMLKPVYSSYINLGAPINTSAKDFFPAVSGDESVMVYNTSQKFYDAIMFCKKVDNKWSTPVNITSEIQSDGNQYISFLSYDGNDLYLRQEDNFQANILISHYENGRWTPSKPLGKNINTKFWEGNACVSKDGQTIYFSSNKKGGSGAMDIYKASKLGTGDWGIPVNLGNVINTEFNEDAPVISENNKRLYFISQGHNTMGGYDIFYSDIDSAGQWKTPVNLGYPINTTDDNLHFYPSKDGKVAYQSFYSKEGLGHEDIFKVLLEPSAAEPTLAIDNLKEEGNTKEVVLQKIEAPKDNIIRELPADVEKALMNLDTTKSTESVVLHSVFFDFNSFELSEGSIKELNNVALVMKNTPELRIIFIGNTDSKGSYTYNLNLSKRRAEAVKKYVLSKGVTAANISINAIGKSNFIAINNNSDGSDNPDGRKFNRRVDVKIAKPLTKPIIIEKVQVPEKLQIK